MESTSYYGFWICSRDCHWCLAAVPGGDYPHPLDNRPVLRTAFVPTLSVLVGSGVPGVRTARVALEVVSEAGAHMDAGNVFLGRYGTDPPRSGNSRLASSHRSAETDYQNQPTRPVLGRRSYAQDVFGAIRSETGGQANDYRPTPAPLPPSPSPPPSRRRAPALS
jgi:hypothetical protein